MLLTTPVAAEAQQGGKVYRIGFLRGGQPPESYLDGFQQGLGERGYVYGQNVVVSWMGLVRLAGCQSTATRFRLGAIALSSSRRLPAKSSEVVASPVILPPGRPRLGTSPNPTGSTTPTKTIGTDVVAFLAARAAGAAEARMTSAFAKQIPRVLMYVSDSMFRDSRFHSSGSI